MLHVGIKSVSGSILQRKVSIFGWGLCKRAWVGLHISGLGFITIGGGKRKVKENKENWQCRTIGIFYVGVGGIDLIFYYYV